MKFVLCFGIAVGGDVQRTPKITKSTVGDGRDQNILYGISPFERNIPRHDRRGVTEPNASDIGNVFGVRILVDYTKGLDFIAVKFSPFNVAVLIWLGVGWKGSYRIAPIRVIAIDILCAIHLEPRDNIEIVGNVPVDVHPIGKIAFGYGEVLLFEGAVLVGHSPRKSKIFVVALGICGIVITVVVGRLNNSQIGQAWNNGNGIDGHRHCRSRRHHWSSMV